MPLAGAAGATGLWWLLTEALALDDPVSENAPWLGGIILAGLAVARLSRRRDAAPPIRAALVAACALMYVVWAFLLVVGVLALSTG